MPGDGGNSSVGILAAVPTDCIDRGRSHPDLGAIRDHSLLEQSPVHSLPILARHRAQEQEVHCTQGLIYVHLQPSRLSPRTQGATLGILPEAGLPGHIADGPLSSGFQRNQARKLIQGQFPKLEGERGFEYLLLTACCILHSYGPRF